MKSWTTGGRDEAWYQSSYPGGRGSDQAFQLPAGLSAPQEPHWFRDIKEAVSSPVHAGRYPNQQYSLYRCSRLPPLSFSLFFSSVHLISSHGLLLFASHVLMLLIFSFSQFSHWSLPLFFLSSDALLLCCPFPFSHLPFNPFPLTFALFSSFNTLESCFALHATPFLSLYYLLLPTSSILPLLLSSHQYFWFPYLLNNERWRDGQNHIDVCVCAFLKGHGCN